MKYIPSTIIFIFLCCLPSSTLAHPGRTDGSGCHTCRTNCSDWGLDTGEYHCHNAKALPQPEEPVTSHYGEQGTGYTTPVAEHTPVAEVVVPSVNPVVKELEREPVSTIERQEVSKDPIVSVSPTKKVTDEIKEELLVPLPAVEKKQIPKQPQNEGAIPPTSSVNIISDLSRPHRQEEKKLETTVPVKKEKAPRWVLRFLKFIITRT